MPDNQLKITLVAPFRLPFELPRDDVLSKHDRWIARIREVENSYRDVQQQPQAAAVIQLGDDGPSLEFGNYSWSKLLDIRERNDVLYGGKGGLDDPGWFFRNHFLMKLSGSVNLRQFVMQDSTVFHALFANAVRWECHILDNTVAVLAATLQVVELDKFAHALQLDKQRFYEYTSELSAHIILDIKTHCEQAIHLIQRKVLNHLEIVTPRHDGLFLGEQPPVYRNLYTPMWTHRAFQLNESLKREQERVIAQIFSSVLSDDAAQTWLREGGYGYGWGATAVTESKRYDRQWLDALCVSQYYYACLDLIDTTLPVAIAKQRSQSTQGKHSSVLEQARAMRAKVNIILNDYNDILIRTAGEAYRGLHGYFKNWYLQSLIDGVNAKMNIYEELINATSDIINKRAQWVIEIILLGITLLSFVGLVAGLHDYLASGYDPRQPETIATHALGFAKSDVLMASLILVLAFLMYVIVRRWRR